MPLKAHSPTCASSATAAPSPELRERLQGLLNAWRESGTPPRQQLMSALREILDWREKGEIGGLYSVPLLMATATLDDGWGHGLEVIEACARAAGIQIERLGLLLSARQIIDRCRELRPQLLGLTVLQLDSEPALTLIASELKGRTQILAGGAPFKIEPELAERAGVDFVARSVADFLDFILAWKAAQPQTR